MLPILSPSLCDVSDRILLRVWAGVQGDVVRRSFVQVLGLVGRGWVGGSTMNRPSPLNTSSGVSQTDIWREWLQCYSSNTSWIGESGWGLGVSVFDTPLRTITSKEWLKGAPRLQVIMTLRDPEDSCTDPSKRRPRRMGQKVQRGLWRDPTSPVQ